MIPVDSERDPSDALRVSVVFATRDREAQLRDTLAAYRRLDTAGISWELIIVDNNSRDATSQVLDEAASDLPIVKLFESGGGQNQARNQALDRIRGELIVFTDDDVLPHRDCLKAYIAAAERWPDEAIFGARIEPRFPTDTPDWMRAPEFSFASTAFARYAPADKECHVKRHPYGPSFAVHCRALGQHKFPVHLGPQRGAYAMGGEGHLLRRLQNEGWSFVHVPSAQVEHIIRPDQITSEWLLQRANKKGRGQAHLPSTKRPRRLYWRGVPLRLWLAALRAGLRLKLLRRLVSSRQQIRLGIKYELRRGQIAEMLAQRSARARR